MPIRKSDYYSQERLLKHVKDVIYQGGMRIGRVQKIAVENQQVGYLPGINR